jgi:epsilon-lactone hydrolase
MYELDLGDAATPGNVEDWEALISFTDEMLLAIIPPPDVRTRVAEATLGGVATYRVEPADPCTDRTCLFLHGGAFTMGGGAACRASTAAFAEGARVRSIGVDYRRPPQHPYPAPLDDCVSAYRAILEDMDAQNVVAAGLSAGGNLAAALVLRARDEGLPLPSSVLLFSPEIDLTEAGDSFETLMGIDPVLRSRLTDSINLYANGHHLTDPYLSPLFGDLSLGFPPTFLQCGTRDLFLSNTVRFHRALRRAGLPAALHVWEAMPHGGFGAMLEGGFGQAPEDREVYLEAQAFLATVP